MAKEFKILKLKEKETIIHYGSGIESTIETGSSYVMKHAVVNRVERLSERYWVAELEVIEEFSKELEPAQYIMLWIPRIDYFPMSIAWFDSNSFQIFFSIRGSGTEALSRSEGSLIGFVGPLGKGLRPEACGNNCLIVAGGTGLASLITLVKRLKKLGRRFKVVWGVRRGIDVGEVPDYFSRLTGSDLEVCTEDCTIGFCGRALDRAKELLREDEYTAVVSSGPNQMSYLLGGLSLKLGIKAYLVLESTFYCGMGLCGSCLLNGLRLCVDGPALSASRVVKNINQASIKSAKGV